MKSLLILLSCISLFLLSSYVQAYTPPQSWNVNLTLGVNTYTPPQSWNVNLTLDETGGGTTECSPTINVDWLITDTQNCNGVNANVGTGTIVISGSGILNILNGANVTAQKLNVMPSGDRVFIWSNGRLILQ